MCGRFSLDGNDPRAKNTRAAKIAAKVFAFDASKYWSFDCRPTTRRAVLFRSDAGTIELAGARWGWQWDFLGSRPIINARSETIAEKKMFSAALRERRCVVPATCYFEWRRDAKDRPLVKYAFRQSEGHLLLIAGLWEDARGEDGLERRFLILTRQMERYADIHDRTPVLLSPNTVEDWMNPKAHPLDWEEAAASMTDEDLIVRPVCNGPTKEKSEGPHLLESTGDPWPW